MTHNLQAEETIIYGCLQSRETFLQVQEYTGASAFFSEEHRLMFEGLSEMHERLEAVNWITLDAHLQKSGKGNFYIQLAEIETKAELGLEAMVPTAQIIEEHYRRRTIYSELKDVILKSQDFSVDVFDLQEEAERVVFDLRRHGAISSVKDMGESVQEVLDHFEHAQQLAKEGKVVGVPSGLSDMDRITLGWQPSDFIVMAARPSVGKSALAMGCAFDAGVPALVFSLEMSARQLTERQLMPETGVSSHKARTGKMSDRDWESVTRASGELSTAPVYIDDRPGLSIAEIKSTARKMKIRHDIGVIVVDYLQLCSGSNLSKSANREQEIAQVSRGLKHLAKELDVPVIGLSQLNRIRHDEKPTLVNLRESGAIEQDADVVLFLWREPDVDGERNPVVNFGFDKNRHGGLGGGQLTFKPQSAKLVAYYEEDAKMRYSS